MSHILWYDMCDMIRIVLLIGSVGIAAAMCAEELKLPFESTVVVTGREESCAFAAKELNEIVKKACGQAFAVSCGRPRTSAPTGGVVGGDVPAPRRIFIGRSGEAEEILGKATFDSLGEEESLVVAKGDDLFLAGGDVPGVLWAVYDFVEDNLGYHWYDRRPGKDVVTKCDTIVYKGKGSRRKPAFTRSRTIEANWRYRSFMLRNRVTDCLEGLVPNWHYKYARRFHGHGYELYLPKAKHIKRYDFIKAYLDQPADNFKKHPEWFSMNEKGVRVADRQLCFSNPELHDALYTSLKRYLDRPTDEYGGRPGIYMIGVNDEFSGTLCCCETCRALDRRHDCGAGAMWELVVDLCNRLKRDGYDDVLLTSLAYRRQCELAPKDIVFPDNFVCYVALGNHSHTPSEWGEEPRREAKEYAQPGEMYNFYENVKAWGRLCTLDAWMYTDPFLSTGYRLKKEINEYYAAGARGAFSNGGFAGSGGGFAFGSINDYLFLRLLYDPSLDVKAEVDRICAAQFGPAAPAVRRFYDMLEETRQAKLATAPRLDGFAYFTGRQLAELGTLFDAARAKVVGTDWQDNFDTVGMYVDMLLTVYSDLVAKDAPDYRYDPSVTAERAGAAADNYVKKWMFGRYQKERDIDVERMLAQMAYYPLLKTKELPAELAKYPAEKVTRVLPEKRRPLEWWWINGSDPYDPRVGKVFTAEEDSTTACGWTMGGDVPAKVKFDAKHPPEFNFYEHGAGKYLILSKKVPMDFFERGKYKLFCLGKSKIHPSVIMNFGTFGVGTQAIQAFNLRRCADPIFLDKEFEIWANVKAEGPMFFKEDAGKKDRLFVSEFFVVDQD